MNLKIQDVFQLLSTFHVSFDEINLIKKFKIKNLLQVGHVRRSFSDELLDQEFEIIYRIKKPKLSDNIIFSCRTGNRSAQAIKQVQELGYEK